MAKELPQDIRTTLELALARLHDLVFTGKAQKRCLQAWSQFVRGRDGNRCVLRHSDEHISAHHICRKSFMLDSMFHTGNGITLCRSFHREVHTGFNGRSDLSLPMDAQGGEKIEIMEKLYSTLAIDAAERGLLRDDFYYLSDTILGRFKMFQGFGPYTDFPGCRVEQAYLIGAQIPRNTLEALAKANDCRIPEGAFFPGATIFDSEHTATGEPTRIMIARF